MRNKLLFLLLINFTVTKTYSQSISELNRLAFETKDYNLAKAFVYSDQAYIKIKDTIPRNTILESDVLSIRGTLFQMKGYFKKALDFHYKSLKIRNKYHLTELVKISNSKLNIGNLLYIIGSHGKSKRYLLESLESYKQSNDDDYYEYLKRYNSLGALFKDIGKTDSALLYLNKALTIIKENGLDFESETGDVYLNLGIIYEEKGYLDKSLSFLVKAIIIQKQSKDLSGLSMSYHHLGVVHELKQDYSMAKKSYNDAASIAKLQNDYELQKDVYLSKAKLFVKEGNQDSSLYYFEQYTYSNQKFNDQSQKKTILELETKYQTEEKNITIKNAQERETFYIIGGIIISMAFVFILFFLIRNYRQKQRIALLQVDVKNNEINELLNQQETASYAAMLEGQDQERLRIARELHDRLGSTLATIKLGLQNEDLPQAQQQVALVNTAISEVRTISHDLSGGNIEQYGLAKALNELKNTLDRSGKITLNLFMEAVNIQASLHVTIYRIVQELVSNTLKHAEATEITFQLSCVDEQLTLIYEDNGKGFDLNHYQPGMGITNIRHRIEKWNGSLEIDAQPNRGTIVILMVPITMQHD
ncbi:MAG: sensor histidine kinase [Fluviicola sp.]|nr:sensor histidine kinase [Fluviicola sp.]